MTARLLLVRHALAAAPGDLRLPGPDLALRPDGIAQARALADRLRVLDPVAVYCSDARRAQQTAEIIATRCKVDLHGTPALREVDFGAWGGLTYDEVTAADPQAASWFSDPVATPPPGGEPIAAAAERVRALWKGLATEYDAPVVLVGHGGSLRLALAAALGMPLAAYWRLRLDCASLSMLTWTAEGPTVERLNETSHLTAAEIDAAGEQGPS